MGKIDAIIEYCWFAKHQVFCTYLIILFGIFATIKPCQITDTSTISKVGYYTFLSWSHGKGLETQNMSYHLNKWHIASKFVDGVYLRSVYIFVGIVFQQVAIAFDAKFVAQHLLAVGTHSWEVFDILI